MQNWTLSYRHQHSSPESVFEWLKGDEAKTVLDPYGDEQDIESVLLSRNDPLINLGLALYGQSHTTGRSLYQSDDETIKRAILSGATLCAPSSDEAWILQDSVISTLISDWKIDCLETLLKNQHIPLQILVAVYQRTAPFDTLEQDKWLSLVAAATLNEGFTKGRFDDWLYDQEALRTAAWRLAETLPVTKASALSLLQISLHVPTPYFDEAQIWSIIQRWQSNEEKVFSDVRQALVKLFSNYSSTLEKLADSSDLGLRKGYYAHRDFSFSEDHQAHFEKDGGDFLDAVLENDSVYFPLGQRLTLERMCRNYDSRHDGSCLRLFERKFEELINSRFHLFDFAENDIPYHLLNDPHERNRLRVEALDRKVSIILGFLQGSPESGSFGYQLFRKLEEMKEMLAQFKKMPYAWIAWGMVGLLAGYIMARI